MAKIRKGSIYKVKRGDGYYYVKVTNMPEYLTPERAAAEGINLADCVYITTRTPYPTSLFGQIESCFLIRKDKLIPLRGKKDQQTLRQIRKVRSKPMFDWSAIYRKREVTNG